MGMTWLPRMVMHQSLAAWATDFSETLGAAHPAMRQRRAQATATSAKFEQREVADLRLLISSKGSRPVVIFSFNPRIQKTSTFRLRCYLLVRGCRNPPTALYSNTERDCHVRSRHSKARKPVSCYFRLGVRDGA